MEGYSAIRVVMLPKSPTEIVGLPYIDFFCWVSDGVNVKWHESRIYQNHRFGVSCPIKKEAAQRAAFIFLAPRAGLESAGWRINSHPQRWFLPYKKGTAVLAIPVIVWLLGQDSNPPAGGLIRRKSDAIKCIAQPDLLIVSLHCVLKTNSVIYSQVRGVLPDKKRSGPKGRFHVFGSSGRTRTCDLVVNSHPLCQLSYRGISIFLLQDSNPPAGGLIRRKSDAIKCIAQPDMLIVSLDCVLKNNSVIYSQVRGVLPDKKRSGPKGRFQIFGSSGRTRIRRLAD